MSVLRTTSLSLLLAATLGLAACGGDDATSSSGTGNGTGADTAQPTSAAGAQVEQQLPEVEQQVQKKVDDRRERLEKITKDIQSGKLTGKEGQKKIDDVVKEIQEDSGDLTSQAKEQAAAAASKSGEEVTELNLGGDDSGDSKK